MRTNDDSALLTACGGTAAGDPAEELALAVRGEYLAMERCAAEVAVTADYGQRVYEFLLSAAVDGEETVLTLREPELAAGITARIGEEGGALEYDGLALDTGPLDGDGLVPRVRPVRAAVGGPVGVHGGVRAGADRGL